MRTRSIYLNYQCVNRFLHYVFGFNMEKVIIKKRIKTAFLDYLKASKNDICQHSDNIFLSYP